MPAVSRSLTECGTPEDLAVHKKQEGETPGTTTPTAVRSSSPSSDSCSQRWDHISESNAETTIAVAPVVRETGREKKQSCGPGAGSGSTRTLEPAPAAAVGRVVTTTLLPGRGRGGPSSGATLCSVSNATPSLASAAPAASDACSSGNEAISSLAVEDLRPRGSQLRKRPSSDVPTRELLSWAFGRWCRAAGKSSSSTALGPSTAPASETEAAGESNPARRTWAEIARAHLPQQPAKQAGQGTRTGAPINTGAASPSAASTAGGGAGAGRGRFDALSASGPEKEEALTAGRESEECGSPQEAIGNDQAECQSERDMNPSVDDSCFESFPQEAGQEHIQACHDEMERLEESPRTFPNEEPEQDECNAEAEAVACQPMTSLTLPCREQAIPAQPCGDLAPGLWTNVPPPPVAAPVADNTGATNGDFVNDMNAGGFVAVPCIQIPDAPCTESDLTDRAIIEGLAAKETCHQRLLRTAHGVRALLYSQFIHPGSPESVWVELYGSLALYGSRNPNEPESWQQDWARHYVRVKSDIDLVVLLKEGATPALVVHRLEAEGGWTLVNQTHVPKFATTQFTLKGCVNDDKTNEKAEVLVDLTCIGAYPHYTRFKRRQEAFQHTFKSVREQLVFRFGTAGAIAFDAYIYLLKGFATKVPGNAMTSFQATCFGLFALQLGLYELKCCQPTGLVLFECFLRFCSVFFNDEHANQWSKLRGYRYSTVDLSFAGRLLPRFTSKWRCEAYFLSVEVQLGIKFTDRVNIAHSLVPSVVCAAAKEALQQKCIIQDGDVSWG